MIATGHLTTLGSATCDSERAIHVGGLGAFPCSHFSDSFHYVALGHLHRPQKVGGSDRIKYSGSPIALSFSEADDKKVVELLEFRDSQLVHQESILIPQCRELKRLKCKAHEVESYLKSYQWPEIELGVFVELMLEDCNTQQYTIEQIRSFIGRDDVSILQLRTVSGLQLDLQDSVIDMNVDEAIRFLREEPRRVFERRLALEQYDEELKQMLLCEFDKVVEEVAGE